MTNLLEIALDWTASFKAINESWLITKVGF